MIAAHSSMGVGFFHGVVKKIFSRGPTVVKFDFINSKLRERNF